MWLTPNQDLAYVLATGYVASSILLSGFYLRVTDMALGLMRSLSYLSYTKCAPRAPDLRSHVSEAVLVHVPQTWVTPPTRMLFAYAARSVRPTGLLSFSPPSLALMGPLGHRQYLSVGFKTKIVYSLVQCVCSPSEYVPVYTLTRSLTAFHMELHVECREEIYDCLPSRPHVLGRTRMHYYYLSILS